MIRIQENEFKEITEYMKVNYGINLSKKKDLIEERLHSILLEKGFNNFSDYFKHIFADRTKTEMTILINKLTTNHTFFMREVEHFDYLKNQILPYLECTAQERDLRVWSAGCSSGEEPYTIAMLMSDYFGSERKKWNMKILATDISVAVLETAGKGIYSAELLQKVPDLWKRNYFEEVNGETYEIREEIRKEVIFRVFNLMDTFPFKKKFQVIFCRNVMIYFDQAAKRQLINKFYDITEPGGYLFIGHSESINSHETRYQYVMPAVYRKRL